MPSLCATQQNRRLRERERGRARSSRNHVAKHVDTMHGRAEEHAGPHHSSRQLHGGPPQAKERPKPILSAPVPTRDAQGGVRLAKQRERETKRKDVTVTHTRNWRRERVAWQGEGRSSKEALLAACPEVFLTVLVLGGSGGTSSTVTSDVMPKSKMVTKVSNGMVERTPTRP